MFEVSPMLLAAIPLVTALTEVIKRYVRNEYAPIISIACGVGVSFLLPASTIGFTILQGVVVGLSASGLYDNTLKRVK